MPVKWEEMKKRERGKNEGGGGMGEGEKGKRGRENIKKGGWKEKKGEGLKGGKKKKKKKKKRWWRIRASIPVPLAC